MNERIRGGVRPSVAACSALLACAWAHAASIEIELDGIDGELLDNARAALDLQHYVDQDISPAQVRLLYAAAPEQIRAALQPFGYYHVEVDSDLQESGDTFHAVFRVERGEPVIVRELHVSMAGPARELDEVRRALEDFGPKEGERLQDGLYESSKAAVDAELRSKGFLDAKLVRRRVAVTRDTHSANIEVHWESGERYSFGPVHFSEAQFSDAFLQKYVPWREGAPYDADELLDLQQRLVDADYFAVASVRPDVEHARNHEIPVEVLLVPDERTVYTAGLYMSTDTGPGGRLGIERRWLNRRGHKAKLGLEYSQRLQEASVNYAIPQPGPFNRNYTFGAAYRDEETDSSRSRMNSLAVAEARERWNGFNRTLGVQFLQSDFEIADERHSSKLVYGEGVLQRRVASDPLFSLHGYSVTFGLRASPGALWSDTDLVQASAQGKWIASIDPENRFILRSEVGAMTVGDFDRLPPKLRFFAGGDRSIRGFDYEAVGERNATGGVIGGKYLAVASAEYEHYFLPSWGAAVFADAGDAFIADFQVHAGAGIGVRWRSPVGLVRLDVAHPVAGEVTGGWRIHFIIGPDL